MPVAFDNQSGQRIARTVLRVENMPVAQRRMPRARWFQKRFPIRVAKLSGGTLSSGGTQTATWWYWDGAAFVENTGSTFTVSGWLLKSGADPISNGKKLVAVWVGIWLVIAVECE